MDAPQTLAAAIRQRAATNPAAVAFVDESGSSLCTFGDLATAADELARTFKALGLTAGDRVLVEMVPAVGLVTNLLALWMGGATVVPIRVDEPLPAQESLAQALEARFFMRNLVLVPRNGGRVQVENRDVLLVMT